MFGGQSCRKIDFTPYRQLRRRSRSVFLQAVCKEIAGFGCLGSYEPARSPTRQPTAKSAPIAGESDSGDEGFFGRPEFGGRDRDADGKVRGREGMQFRRRAEKGRHFAIVVSTRWSAPHENRHKSRRSP